MYIVNDVDMMKSSS